MDLFLPRCNLFAYIQTYRFLFYFLHISIGYPKNICDTSKRCGAMAQKLVKTTVALTSKEYRLIKDLAKRNNTTISMVIRYALHQTYFHKSPFLL